MTDRSILLSMCFIVMLSCQKDEAIVVQQETGLEQVDNRMHDLFVKFQEEASGRGVRVDYTQLNIEGSIEDIPEENVAGLCRWGGNHQNVIIDSRIWNSNNPILIEVITFHELGHCVLNLGHDDEVLDNNVCKSIMNSGLGDCRTLYSNNREYYLNELFDQATD